MFNHARIVIGLCEQAGIPCQDIDHLIYAARSELEEAERVVREKEVESCIGGSEI